MILGILSLLLSFWGAIPLVMAIVAVSMGGWSLKVDKDGKGMAITGLVTGILGIISGLFWSIIWTGVIAGASAI
jgi:hypothetical protein